MLLRLQRYNLKLIHIPGKLMYVPDTLSRAVNKSSSQRTDTTLQDEAECMVHSVVENLNCSDFMLSKIKSETNKDATLECVKHYITNSWPDYIKDCENLAKPYWPVRHELVVYQDLILINDRIVSPGALMPEILERSHHGHQGRVRCKNLARQVVYWKGMSADIDKMVDKCESCLLQRNAPPREPLISHDVPSRAWLNFHNLLCNLANY